MPSPTFYVVDLVSHSNQLSLWQMPLTDLNRDRACNISFKQFFPQGVLHYVRGENKGMFCETLPNQYKQPKQHPGAANAVLHLGTSSDATLHAFQSFSVSSLEPTPEKYYELCLFPLRGQPLEARACNTYETGMKKEAIVHILPADACAVGQITLVREPDYARALDVFQQRISQRPSVTLPAARPVNAAILLGKHPPECFDHYVLYGQIEM